MENYVSLNWLDGDVDSGDVEGLYEAAEAVIDAQGLTDEPGRGNHHGVVCDGSYERCNELTQSSSTPLASMVG
jgi:hypothetical protein